MAISRDATSGWYMPASNSEWTELLIGTGIPNPSHLYLFQESSGNPADSIGSKALTASGTLSYQQTVTGWARKSIRTTRSATGMMLNNTFGNVNANSYTALLFAFTATAGLGLTRTVFRLGTTFDDDACIETNTTPRMQVGEGDGTRSVNSVNPADAVNTWMLRINDTGNQVDGLLNGVLTTGGAQDCNGTELCFGGDNNNTWFPGDTDYLYAPVWTSSLANADITTLLDRLQNGPDYTATLAKTLGALTVASAATFSATAPHVTGSGHAQKTQPADTTNPSAHAARVQPADTTNPSGHASRT